MTGGFFKTLSFSLKLGPFVPAVFGSRAFFFLSVLSGFTCCNIFKTNYVPTLLTWCPFYWFMCFPHHPRLPWCCWRSRCLGFSCHLPNQHYRHRLLHPLQVQKVSHDMLKSPAQTDQYTLARENKNGSNNISFYLLVLAGLQVSIIIVTVVTIVYIYMYVCYVNI